MRKLSFKKYAAFSLLEILVSAVIFSIGMLGLVGIQIYTIKISNDAKYASQASFLASEIADRMRANTTEFLLGAASTYNNPNQTSIANPNCLGIDGTGAAVATVCTNAQMASHDFYEWNAMLGGQAATAWHPEYKMALPNGSGVVCIDSTPNDGTPGTHQCDNVVSVGSTPIYAIKIWWNEKDDANGTVTKSYVSTVQP